MLKWIERINGKKMTTIRVPFHLDSWDVAEILAACPTYTDEDKSQLDYSLSRAAVEKVIRDEMWLRGTTGREWDWTEGLSRDSLRTRVEWASLLLREQFPDSDTPELKKWEEWRLKQ